MAIRQQLTRMIPWVITVVSVTVALLLLRERVVWRERVRSSAFLCGSLQAFVERSRHEPPRVFVIAEGIDGERITARADGYRTVWEYPCESGGLLWDSPQREYALAFVAAYNDMSKSLMDEFGTEPAVRGRLSDVGESLEPEDSGDREPGQ